MILFVSGRCDIPAFYSDWFYNRLKAGFVDVRNPYDPHQISRIMLTDANIDALLFCTKNPLPMMDRLALVPFPYLFHITLTPYHRDIEPNVIDKHKIITGIIDLSKRIGRDRVIVRYDPILLNERYTLAYHLKAFDKMMMQLSPYIHTVIFSFVDLYKNTKAHLHDMHLKPILEADMHRIAEGFSIIAQKYQISLQTCGEEVDLSMYQVKKGACISKEIMEQLLGHPYEVPKGPPVRRCNCLASVDIGDYNACKHLCRYCYANYDEQQIKQRCRMHDPNASVLLGHIDDNDHITIKAAKSYRQTLLF